MSPKRPKPARDAREPYISQTDGHRVVVPGHLARTTEGGDLVAGGRCTLTFLRAGPWWVVYRHGITEDPVLIAAEDARRLAAGIGEAP